jgi:hypothetical protein
MLCRRTSAWLALCYVCCGVGAIHCRAWQLLLVRQPAMTVTAGCWQRHSYACHGSDSRVWASTVHGAVFWRSKMILLSNICGWLVTALGSSCVVQRGGVCRRHLAWPKLGARLQLSHRVGWCEDLAETSGTVALCWAHTASYCSILHTAAAC